MVSPMDAMKTVGDTIIRSGELPEETNVLLQEADEESDDADVELPLLEIELIEIDDVEILNTEFVDFALDDDGNQIGRIFLSEYEMMMRLNLWSTKGDGIDVDKLGETLRRVLYRHSSYGPQKPFLDGDGNEVDDITFFQIDRAERTDDLATTPTVRRFTHEVELWGYEQFQTDEGSPVSGFDTPSADDLTSGPGDDEISTR